jgi:hypothetical protein
MRVFQDKTVCDSGPRMRMTASSIDAVLMIMIIFSKVLLIVLPRARFTWFFLSWFFLLTEDEAFSVLFRLKHIPDHESIETDARTMNNEVNPGLPP